MQLSKIAQQNSLVALPLVMQLLGKNGHYKFDTITKTKTVESILTLLTTSGIEEFMKYLLSVFFEPAVILKEDLSPERVDNIRRWVLEQMALLVRTGKLEKNQGWLMQIVQFTIQFGFFNPTTSSADPNSLVRVLETPLSPSTTSFFRSTLLTNLGYLNSIILTKDGGIRRLYRNHKIWTAMER